MINKVEGTPSTPAPTAAMNGLGKDTFLKLLVAQLRYQDPMSPLNGQEYLAQMAQFAAVERLDGLASAQADALVYQKVLLSSTLVGKHVSALDELGEPVEGVVASVRFDAGVPKLDVGGTFVTLDSVEEVTAPA